MNAVSHFGRYTKVIVIVERRDDGGLRAYSEDVPGFVLSHSDPEAVLRDIGPALEAILSAMWGMQVHADPLPALNDPDSALDVSHLDRREHEYLAHVC